MCLMSMVILAASAQTKTTYDWTKVINAIAQVESKGNPKAVNKNGNCVGLLQITPILVKECNNILKQKKSSKRYTLSDRRSAEKSREMFILLQEHFNKEHNVEKAIKCWNGGFYGRAWKSKNRYYRKVMRYYKGGD